MRKRGYDELSDSEKETLTQGRERIGEAYKKEPENLREHLQTFNDGVIAIIITIIVLEIKPPVQSSNYAKFFGDILIFLITFLIIADFWYDLHINFSLFITKPDKYTAIADFFFLADLSLLPIMTKWIMEDTSSFAVTCYGIVFFLAKILLIIVQYAGSLPTLKDNKVIKAFKTRASIRNVISSLFLNVILIILSLYIPKVAMILYVTIPILSFIVPADNFYRRNQHKKDSAN